MTATAIGITDLSIELNKIYLLRVNEHYGVGKVKPITTKDRARLWLKMNEQIVDLLGEVDILYPQKIN